MKLERAVEYLKGIRVKVKFHVLNRHFYTEKNAFLSLLFGSITFLF